MNLIIVFLINLCIRAKIQQAKVATRIQGTQLRQERKKENLLILHYSLNCRQ